MPIIQTQSITQAPSVTQAPPITQAQPFAQTVNRIIIGLGGQGCKIVNSVAEYLDSHGGIPETEAFIFIDSHNPDLECLWKNINNINANHSKIYLSPINNKTIFGNKIPYFPDEVIDDMIAAGGVGTRRAMGKALYEIHKNTSVLNKINTVAQSLKQHNPQAKDFLLIIVCALGGGTGSGILPDLSLDLKKLLTNNLGNAKIFGIGILPKQGEEDPNNGNAIAALKELNYLLSINKGIDKFFNPYSMFILVGREGSHRIQIDNTLEQTIIRFLVDLGFAPGNNTDGQTVPQNKWLDLNDLSFRLLGSSGKFSTIGYQAAEFPANKILICSEIEKEIEKIEKKIEKLDVDIKKYKNKIKDIEKVIENSGNYLDNKEIEDRTFTNTRIIEGKNKLTTIHDFRVLCFDCQFNCHH